MWIIEKCMELKSITTTNDNNIIPPFKKTYKQKWMKNNEIL